MSPSSHPGRTTLGAGHFRRDTQPWQPSAACAFDTRHLVERRGLHRPTRAQEDSPEQPRHQHARREYELRRAEATTAAFERLEVLGPVIVEVKLSEDLLAARTLALSLKPRRAELRGKQAEVMRQLLDGRKSRLVRVDTPEARKKRRQRDPKGTLRCIGRGERRQATLRHLNVPASLPLEIEVTSTERWLRGSIA